MPASMMKPRICCHPPRLSSEGKSRSAIEELQPNQPRRLAGCNSDHAKREAVPYVGYDGAHVDYSPTSPNRHQAQSNRGCSG